MENFMENVMENITNIANKERSERPWGYYTILTTNEGYQVKEIFVKAGMRLSYQTHKFRSEHWFISKGVAEVMIDGVVKELSAGQSVDIGIEVAHRIGAKIGEDLVFIEVQSGSYLGEDDIVRLEDDYGRN
jgi:mannose-6-phosphate isomerase-like protein (cupin superfamily)